MEGADSIVRKKAEKRHELRRRLKGVPRGELEAAGGAIARHVLESGEYARAGTIFCFVGTRWEIPTDEIIDEALVSGRRVAVPLCGAPGEMTARVITSRGELVSGAYGILEPSADAAEIRPEEIDLVLVPCLSCSEDGRRLGKGGGYYDRFLERSLGDKMMLCPSVMIDPGIPTEPHDVVIPVVVTEHGVIRVP